MLALVTFASLVATLFGGELLDPLGVPGIWFPFGIGVSRTQYIYAIAVPLLAFLDRTNHARRSGDVARLILLKPSLASGTGRSTSAG